METLRRLAAYNAWANRRMFAACDSVTAEQLSVAGKGSIGSIEATLKHLVGVEDAYLAMVQGQDLDVVLGDRDAYDARDLAWFRRRSNELAEGYATLLSASDEAWLVGTMTVPWFGFPMTVRDGLLQAMQHSAQHRAQILSALGAQGVAVPDVDYVVMMGGLHVARTGQA